MATNLFTIDVVGGVGSKVVDLRGSYTAVGVKSGSSPYPNLVFSIEVYDEDGFIALKADGVAINPARIMGQFTLHGESTINLYDVVPDGQYQIKLHDVAA